MLFPNVNFLNVIEVVFFQLLHLKLCYSER